MAAAHGARARRRGRRAEDGTRRRAGKQVAASARADAQPATLAQATRHQQQLELGWASIFGADQLDEMHRRAGVLVDAWGGRDQVCPQGLYWAVARDTLVGVGCRKKCCAGRVLGRAVLPCSLGGDLHSLEAAIQGIDGVYGTMNLFGGALEGLGPWRKLDQELAERGAWEQAEQRMADSAAAVEAAPSAAPSARQRRWADSDEEEEEEVESGAGQPAPPSLPADAIARAEGFGVTDVPAAADENHLSSILGDSEDEML